MFKFRVMERNELLTDNDVAVEDLFLSLEWLIFVEKSNNLSLTVIEISNESQRVGYLSGFIFSVFGIKIFGSPFRGWSTCHMGFQMKSLAINAMIVDEAIDYLFKMVGCKYVEIIDRKFNEVFRAEFKGITEKIESIEVDLGNSIDDLFSSFKKDARNFVRQFDKKGGKIRRVNPSMQFAAVYYDQLVDVFSRQNAKPTYSLEKVRFICDYFKESDSILCLQAENESGVCIASSIFFADKNRAFFWGGASYRIFQGHRPNEAMIWFAFQYWKNKGCKTIDLVGIRDYKLKFSPEKITYFKIIASKYRILILLRNFAERLFFLKLKIEVLLAKIFLPPKSVNKK